MNKIPIFDKKLNQHPTNIFRLGSKPNCLQIKRNLFGNVHNHLPNKSKNVNCSESRFLWKTLSSKVDLIWHLRPICKVENARTLILFLSSFLQKLDFGDQHITFYLKFLISTPVFHEKALFHLEPSGIYFL